MAQITQIVPKFSFPYVETVINDYTQVNSTTDVARTNPIVTYVFPFISSKGIDNVFIRKTSLSSFVSTYGNSNYKKYGQPLMMPLSILQESNTHVWCMRVMPENATYSNNVISLYYKADEVSEDTDASKRKFRIKFTQKNLENITNIKDFKASINLLDGDADNGVYVDDEGYTQAPFMSIRSAGRGSYGDNYCVRISPNTTYEKEYGIKMYNFEILTVEGGLQKIASYTGSVVSSAKYDASTLIDDILDNTEDGVVPVYISINEDNLETVYDAYVAFLKEQKPLLEAEYDTKFAKYSEAFTESDIQGMIDGTVKITNTTAEIESVTVKLSDVVSELKNIKNLILQTTEDNIIDFDEFDPFFANGVASTSVLPFVSFPSEKPSTGVPGGEDAKDYTDTTNMPVFGSVKGVALSSGSNGYFDNPRIVDEAGNILTSETVQNKEGGGTTVTYKNADGSTYEGPVTQWTVDQEIEECYLNAFNGVYDRRILSSRRIAVDAFWDANYPFSVKKTMADLAIVRADALCYLDSGIDYASYSKSNLSSLIKDYSVFDNCLISKNIQHFTVKETPSQKKVTVSITYFLARQYAQHIAAYGAHIPFVKAKAQLSGHVRDSLEPSIEDYEQDLKETLYTNRFNYFETLDENVFQRATQSTSQVDDTDLIEENNVATLYDIKRIVEDDIQAELYDFADSDTRERFTEYEKAKFANWVGSKVSSFDIQFKVNSWEFDNSILHAYIDVTFRGIQKRSILEIDINKRTYNESVSDDTTSSNNFIVL